MHSEMAAKSINVLFCYYLLLAGAASVASAGFTPVTYTPRESPECGQYEPLQDEQLIETQQIDSNR